MAAVDRDRRVTHRPSLLALTAEEPVGPAAAQLFAAPRLADLADHLISRPATCLSHRQQLVYRLDGVGETPCVGAAKPTLQSRRNRTRESAIPSGRDQRRHDVGGRLSTSRRHFRSIVMVW